MDTDDPDPLFTAFLKDFDLEHLDADQRASLRAYLSRLGRNWEVGDSLAAEHERELEAQDDYGAKLLRREGSVTKDVDLEF